MIGDPLHISFLPVQSLDKCSRVTIVNFRGLNYKRDLIRINVHFPQRGPITHTHWLVVITRLSVLLCDHCYLAILDCSPARLALGSLYCLLGRIFCTVTDRGAAARQQIFALYILYKHISYQLKLLIYTHICSLCIIIHSSINFQNNFSSLKSLKLSNKLR